MTASVSAFAPLSRRSFFRVAGGAAVAAGALSLTACNSGDKPGETGPRKVVIGTMATEDFLPVWVAEAEGLFDTDALDVQIQVFQSATELQAGIKSKQVDFAMTDHMVTAGIFASGTNVGIQWITLGTSAAQGRFGIMVNAAYYEAGFKSLKRLAGVEIGVGSNTILEYVMDKLMAQAGVEKDKVKKAEVQKLPVRFQNMMDGVITAAALPGSLLALGEALGCVCIADDTVGENLSQSVMIARQDWVDADAEGTALAALKAAWNAAAQRINANPGAYRSLLVEKANLNDAVADTYPISEYPLCQMPEASMVNEVLDWMTEKGYLEHAIAYNEETGTFSPVA